MEKKGRGQFCGSLFVAIKNNEEQRAKRYYTQILLMKLHLKILRICMYGWSPI
jgi:hypothetical protein